MYVEIEAPAFVANVSQDTYHIHITGRAAAAAAAAVGDDQSQQTPTSAFHSTNYGNFL